jgi:hypothetical protein
VSQPTLQHATVKTIKFTTELTVRAANCITADLYSVWDGWLGDVSFCEMSWQ